MIVIGRDYFSHLYGEESTNKIHREFKIAETSFFFFFSFPILSFHKVIFTKIIREHAN